MLHRTVLTMALLIGLSGCLSDSDDTPRIDRSQGPNLTITTIDVANLNYYVPGETIRVDFELVVQELDYPDVDIDFYVVHAQDSAGEGEEIEETHYLGTKRLSKVENGSVIASFVETVPDVTITGNYWIMAVVDPQNTVEEAFEDDNHPNLENEAHTEGNFPYAIVDLEHTFKHDFAIVNAALSEEVLVLDTPAVHANTALGTNNADMHGYIDALYYGQEVAQAELLVEVMIDGNYEPIEIWVNQVDQATTLDQEGYQLSKPMDFTYNREEHIFGLDLRLTQSQIERLYATYDASQRNTLSVRFEVVDNTDYQEEFDDSNNILDLEVPLYFFEDETEATSGKAAKAYSFDNGQFDVNSGYSNGFGDASKFKVGIDFDSDMQIDLPTGSAHFEAAGAMDLYVFNKANSIFSIDVDSKASVTGENTGVSGDVVLFNKTVYEQSIWRDAYTLDFSKTWEENKTLVQSTFFIGPVPLSVEAGISGEMGMGANLTYEALTLTVTGDLFKASLGGAANGGINTGVAKAGITLDLTVLENVLAMEATTDMRAYDNNTGGPTIDWSFAIVDDINAIEGKFGLYAETYGLKWCKKKIFGKKIKYPCGTKTYHYDYWFYQTPSIFSKHWTIYSESGRLQ